MRGRSEGAWWGVALDAPDSRALAGFYSKLLDWPIAKKDEGWTVVSAPSGAVYLAFQTSPEYVAPVWPPADGAQQMMAHLDLEVDDLEAAVDHAVELGATVAQFQPQDDVRVLLDPVGHPFCLYLDR